MIADIKFGKITGDARTIELNEEIIKMLKGELKGRQEREREIILSCAMKRCINCDDRLEGKWNVPLCKKCRLDKLEESQ